MNYLLQSTKYGDRNLHAQGAFIIYNLRMQGIIQQLRNPFLRHFSLGNPLFHCIIFWLTSGWCFEDYVILELVNNNFFYPIIHLYQEPADGYIGSFIIVPKDIF